MYFIPGPLPARVLLRGGHAGLPGGLPRRPLPPAGAQAARGLRQARGWQGQDSGEWTVGGATSLRRLSN